MRRCAPRAPQRVGCGPFFCRRASATSATAAAAPAAATAAAALRGRRFEPRGPLLTWHNLLDVTSPRPTERQQRRDDWSKGRGLEEEERRCGLLTTVADTDARHRGIRHGGNAAAFGGIRGSGAADAATSAPRSAETALVAGVGAATRVRCAIKADAADWQANEVASDGSIAGLRYGATRVRKGAWRKVAPATKVKVENDKLPETDPAKDYVEYVVDRGTYAQRLGTTPHGTPVLGFVLYREGVPTEAVLQRLARTTRCSRDAVALPVESGLGAAAGFGCVTHSGRAIGLSQEALLHASRHFNIRPMLFLPEHYTDLATELRVMSGGAGRPCGYFYRVLLRCVEGSAADVAAALARVQARGFVNYFPLSTFGIGSNSAHEIASAALGAHNNNNNNTNNNNNSSSGDLWRAVSLFLQGAAERNPLLHRDYVRHLSLDASAVADHFVAWASSTASQRQPDGVAEALRLLADGGGTAGNDASTVAAAWRACAAGPHEAALCRAAQGFVWNAMASQRLLSYPADRAVVGDVVRFRRAVSAAVVVGNAAGQARLPATREEANAALDIDPTDPGGASMFGPWEYAVVATPAEAALFSARSVVLPLPAQFRVRGSSGGALAAPLFPQHACNESLYRDFAAAHGLSAVFGASSATAASTALAGLRRFAVDTEEDCYRPLLGCASHVTHEWLRDPRSLASLKSDLTLFQERQPFGVGLGHGRVREPSPLNQSPALRATLAPVLADAAASHQRGTLGSVALSFFLPFGQHPLCFLREIADARHVHFQDLLHLPQE